MLFSVTHTNPRAFSVASLTERLFSVTHTNPKLFSLSSAAAVFSIMGVALQYSWYEHGDYIHFTVSIANAGGKGATSFLWELLDSDDDVLDSGTEDTGIIGGMSTDEISAVSIDYSDPGENTKIKVRVRLSIEDDWIYSAEADFIYSISPPPNPIPRDPTPPPI